MLKKVLLVAAILGLTGLGMAQTGGLTGNIIGTVSSEEGPLPGVTVTITSPAMILPSMSVVTGANGAFRFSGLAPGMYEMTVELMGMQTVIRKGLRVLVAQNTTIDIVMQPATLEESVTVIGLSPTVDKQRTTRAVNLDKVFLQSVPAARNLGTFFNMAPGVVAESAHGGSTMDSAYYLDGVNMVDAATGRPNVVFGLDIMEEISVQQGGLSAEYGSVRAAVVNVVTKSGGNTFSGSSSFYFNHEKLKSDNTVGTPLEGSKSGNKLELEPSLSLGGPIVKDKLWFFVMASFNSQERFVAGYPAGSAAGQEKPFKSKTYYPFLKLSFQPGAKDKFSLSYNFSDNRIEDNGASKFATESVTQKVTRPTHVISLHWTRFFSNNFYFNLKYGGNLQTFNLDAKGSEAQTVIGTTGVSSGNAWRNQDHYKRNRHQFNADATVYIDDLAGTHELKFGGEAQMAFTGWKIQGVSDPLTGGCYNYYISPADYEAGRWYYTLVLVNNGFDRLDNMIDYAAFVHDNWAITRKLNLSLGLRFEYNSIVYPPQNQDEGLTPFFGQTYNRMIPEKITMYKWANLAPRAGLIYDVFADGKTLLKASWSRYLIPNQIGFVNVAHPNGWFGYYLYGPGSGANAGLISPWAYPGGEQNPNGTKIGYKDYSLKAGHTDELTIGVERELLPDFSAGIRYIRKWDRNQPNYADNFQLDLDKLMSTDELDWSRNWTSKTGTDPFNGQTVTFYERIVTSGQEMYLVNPPGANRDYDGVEFNLDKRYSNGWAAGLSYVYAKSRGLITTARADESLGGASGGFFQSPNAHTNADGLLPLERRHQIKLTGLVKGPFGINISGYFQYLDGYPGTRTITNNFIGLPLKQNVTIYAEKRGSEKMPPFVQLDLRLEKTFKISMINLGIFADCFNVMNRGAATGWWMNSSNTSTYKYKEMTAINTPRIFQLGARIE
ncbi:MAG: carboxypeptidase regulatory-like domain-containing protein, partial [Candidatus Aminicenantales bacterium]